MHIREEEFKTNTNNFNEKKNRSVFALITYNILVLNETVQEIFLAIISLLVIFMEKTTTARWYLP